MFSRQQRSALCRLMEADVTIPLAVVAVILLAIGLFWGFAAMLQASLYTVVGLLVIGLPLLLAFSHQAEANQFRRLQQEFGGRVQWGWPFLRPALAFRHRGTMARIRILRHGEDDDAEVEIAWPQPGLRLVVRTRSLLPEREMITGIDFDAADMADFARRFVVEGSDPARVRAILSDDTRRAILSLPEQRDLFLQIGDGRLTCRARYFPMQTDLIAWTGAVLRLYDMAQATHARFG